MVSFDAQGKLSLKLNAQSPMVHFQAREPGATVRASEVKPKLDRYLIRKLARQTGLDGAALAKIPEYKDWFRPSTDENVPPTALRYQMQIFCEDAPEIVVLNLDNDLKNKNKVEEEMARYAKSVSKYPIFYANSGVKDPKQQRLGIVSNPTVVIRCFHDGLKDLIKKNLEDFFLVTNFGTMQNKGFGSFAPVRPNGNRNPNMAEIRRIAGLLKREHGVQRCLYMIVERNNDFSSLFQAIEHFYRLMKSGYNNEYTDELEPSFLFRYMHSEYGIGNEKAWMKQNHISPVVGWQPEFPPSEDHPPRYVRAFLGTAETMSYKKAKQGNAKIDISIHSDDIQRAPSTIFFKIVGNTVLIVPCPVEDALYGKSFVFTPKEKVAGKYIRPFGYQEGTLDTPDKNQFPNERFDTEDFLMQYADHYNYLVRDAYYRSGTVYKYLKNAPEVNQI